jgi:acetyl esterase/lipase
LCFQFLGIPELDDRLETPSMRQFTDTPLWNRPSAEYSWRWYLGDQVGDVSAYAAPARAIDLAGLPPAYVSTMEFDPLRDEGIIYAMRLLEAGVPVELHQYPGTFHGSSLVTTAAVSQRQAAEMIDVLRRGLRL